MMPSKIPRNSEERKRLLQSFFDLPSQEKMMFYSALEHLRWLTILWDLEELEADSMPSTPEKRHILLAYKFLQLLWFDELPDQRLTSIRITHQRQLEMPTNRGEETATLT